MQRISVIIPNYNHALYLKERIDSVLNQTYSDFEIIILDDCSTDNSREVIESYRDNPKVSHIVYNEQNSGSTFKQWKKGIELAQGEWIWLAESDDVAEKDFLEVLLNASSDNEKLTVVYSASNCIDSRSEEIGIASWAYDLKNRDWTRDYTNNGIEEIKHFFYYKNIIPNASSTLFKRQIALMQDWDSIQKMKFAGDWMFWIKMLEYGDIRFCSNRLNKFRFHQLTTRNSFSFEKEKMRFRENFEILNYLRVLYHLPWDHKMHYWIIWDFVVKTQKLNTIMKLVILKSFPYRYWPRVLVLILRIKFKIVLLN